MMSAYVVFTHVDQGELDVYAKEAQTTVAGHEVKKLAFYGSHEDLEGPSTEGTAILEFPSIEAAKAWYNGSPYREVREESLRHLSGRPKQKTSWPRSKGAVSG